eukprot:2129276-Rhodomonas_salina.1
MCPAVPDPEETRPRTHCSSETHSQSADTANRLVCYADSDHAGHPDTRHSVTGYVVMLNGAAVSWQSTRQQVTALSTAETEYYAASVAGTDVTYMSRIMEDLGFAQLEPTVLWEDNMACIYMSQTSVMYHKARHIDTRVYHLRELCKDGALVLKKVSSAEHVADSLTKSTPKPAFEKHRDAMLGAVDERTGREPTRYRSPQAFDPAEIPAGVHTRATCGHTHTHPSASEIAAYQAACDKARPGLLTASGSRLAAESMVVWEQHRLGQHRTRTTRRRENERTRERENA